MHVAYGSSILQMFPCSPFPVFPDVPSVGLMDSPCHVPQLLVKFFFSPVLVCPVGILRFGQDNI